MQTLLLDLRDAVWALRRQNAALREELGADAHEAVKAERDELKGLVKQLKMQRMFMMVVIAMFVATAVVMWLG